MEEKKNNKPKIILIIAIAVALIVTVVTLIIVNLNNSDQINEAYFHSNDRRLVYEPRYSDPEMYFEAKRVFEVYTYEGQEVTGHAIYYEYDDDYSANKRIPLLEEEGKKNSLFQEVQQYDKYVAIILRDDNLIYWTTDSLRSYIKDKERFRDQTPSTTEEEE